jgi:hypothetical protein
MISVYMNEVYIYCKKRYMFQIGSVKLHNPYHINVHDFPFFISVLHPFYIRIYNDELFVLN